MEGVSTTKPGRVVFFQHLLGYKGPKIAKHVKLNWLQKMCIFSKCFAVSAHFSQLSSYLLL